jgi:hypothetical protein
MSKGSYRGLDGCDFISCSGNVACIKIKGDQIAFVMTPHGWPYGDVTFAGTFNESAGQITKGTYSGWTAAGPVSGTFIGTRPTPVQEDMNRANLNPFFGQGAGPYNLRDFLPQFNECNKPIADTVGYGLNPSKPDPTLGGILPDFTQQRWDFGFEPCNIALEDAILAIQVMSSVSSGQGVIVIEDVNEDGKIGVEEVIYLLQKASGLR